MLKFIIFVLVCQTVFAQLYWNASSELGYFNSESVLFNKQDDILARLNLRGGYKHKTRQNIANFNLQIRPEIYSLENALHSTKISLSGFYKYISSLYDLYLNLNASRYYFDTDELHFSYESFFFDGQILKSLSSFWAISNKLGIAYRNFDKRDAVSLNTLFLDCSLVYNFNAYFKSEAGFYIEKFEIENKYNFFSNSLNKNDGLRFGPLIRFNYIRSFITTINYQFLLHDSKITKYTSYDHQIRLIAGKSFSNSWSAFILVDFYKNNFNYEDGEFDSSILYAPVNQENHVFLKISNSITQNQKVFIKAGYFDEKLFYRDYSLTGWKGYIGFEIKG